MGLGCVLGCWARGEGIFVGVVDLGMRRGVVFVVFRFSSCCEGYINVGVVRCFGFLVLGIVCG